jgi:hypothetical protein
MCQPDVKSHIRLPLLLSLAILSIVLCGCPMLDHKIFIRNTSTDTAYITFVSNTPFDTVLHKNIAVRGSNKIIPVERKNISLLNESFIAVVENAKVTLLVPPNSTAYISDILRKFYSHENKALIIKHGGKSDSMSANYPYRSLKAFRRKFDPQYNYFYRTLLYYDITQK